jgi:hypothetical protein
MVTEMEVMVTETTAGQEPAGMVTTTAMAAGMVTTTAAAAETATADSGINHIFSKQPSMCTSVNILVAAFDLLVAFVDVEYHVVNRLAALICYKSR